MDYDCFLSHNGKDKPAVRELYDRLQDAGLRVWLDENELPFGLSWQPRLEDGIRRSAAGLVAIGPNGTSDWNAEEMEVMLSDARKRIRPVIPVLLVGAPESPDLPKFLMNRTRCDLGNDVDGRAFQKLVRELLTLREEASCLDAAAAAAAAPLAGGDASCDQTSPGERDLSIGHFPEHTRYRGDRLSLQFQDIEVRAILQLLADFTGLNLVASDTVRGNISLRLKNVPWDQALDIILSSKGLSMRQNGNVIMIAPNAEIAAQEKLELELRLYLEELTPLVSEFIQVKYRKAADMAAVINSGGANLLSQRGNIIVDQLTNTILVKDTIDRLDSIRRFVARIDIPVRYA